MSGQRSDTFGILECAAARWPDQPAIIDEFGTLTFAELLHEARSLKTSLAHAGVRSRQGIGVVTRNNRHFLIALFAALAAEAVVMPISHQLRDPELSAVLENTSLAFLIDDQSSPVLQSRVGSVFTTSWGGTLRISPQRNTVAALVPQIPDAAFVRFTSGTTGRSKGVVLSHRAVAERIEAAQHVLELQPGEKVCWVLPMAYHFVVSIVLYVRYGACLVTCHDMLSESILGTINREKCSVLYATPTHYRVLSADQSALSMPSIRRAISTSSPIPREVAEAFFERFRVRPCQVYGMIEIGLPLANFSEDTPDSLGRAVAGCDVVVLDEQGVVLPPGQVGQLAVRGPGMFDAYLTPFAKRESTMLNGFFPTGDFALRTTQGDFRLMGRKKSLINIAGNKVFPEEVEAVLNSHCDVEISRVFAERHSLTGEIVCAELVLREGAEIRPDDLRSYCYSRLSSYKVPKEIKFVTAISMTPTGKVLRHEGAKAA